MTRTILSLVILLASVCYAHTKQPPNIVFILADDLGWDDVSFHGSNEIPTPNLDALAADGILLNNYYVQPICTPSRSALMTGRHPIHTGMQDYVILPPEPWGLGLEEKLLPQYLKDIGYRTHIVGKWHLGMFAEEYTPIHRGFDTHFGYMHANQDYFDHQVQSGPQIDTLGLDFWNNSEVYRSAFGQYSTEIFTTEAERIIQSHDTSKPLFLYLAHQAVHSGNKGYKDKLPVPWKYRQNFHYIQSEERQKLAAMISVLDESVGNVTLALNEKGLLNNTILVFSTDNGGPADGEDFNVACNWPLRGGKKTMWEGGVRGNGFIWSPLLKKSQYVSEHMIQIIDWLPTLLEAAGYDVSLLPYNLDGVSQWKALTDNLAIGPRNHMLHNINPVDGDGALRLEHMKVVWGAGYTKMYNGWYRPDSASKRTATSDLDTDDFTIENSQIIQKQRSHLWSVFEKLGRTPGYRSTLPLRVKCGPMPPDVSTSCEPWIKPCLFNITADPCEYHNLANAYPVMLTLMLQRVNVLKASMVPPRNKPEDPRSYPVWHDGVWKPWVKL